MENRPWSRRRSFSRNVPTARNMAFTVTENPLVLLNLPRHERYKFENIIVAGILPGPSEPKLTANTFLEPLVRELQVLWACKHHCKGQLVFIASTALFIWSACGNMVQLI